MSASPGRRLDGHCARKTGKTNSEDSGGEGYESRRYDTRLVNDSDIPQQYITWRCFYSICMGRATLDYGLGAIHEYGHGRRPATTA